MSASPLKAQEETRSVIRSALINYELRWGLRCLLSQGALEAEPGTSLCLQRSL